MLRCRMFTCTCTGGPLHCRMFALTCTHPCRRVSIQNVDLLFCMFLMVRCRLSTSTHAWLCTPSSTQSWCFAPFCSNLHWNPTLHYKMFACTCAHTLPHTQPIERTHPAHPAHAPHPAHPAHPAHPIQRTQGTQGTQRTQRNPRIRRTQRNLNLKSRFPAALHFFDISTSKIVPNLVCFMCFAPQRRALFPHLNFQKWSAWGVFSFFTCKRVSRHNSVQFLDISTSKSGLNVRCF